MAGQILLVLPQPPRDSGVAQMFYISHIRLVGSNSRATLECERLDRRNYRTQAEARMSVFQYIEGWYNLHRRHSALGYLSPMNFEKTSSDVALAAD